MSRNTGDHRNRGLRCSGTENRVKQIAVQLGSPQAYVQHIQEMTENYRQGKLLTENQHERKKQDLTAYQEQLRQAQVQQQKQRSPRMGGFSL